MVTKPMGVLPRIALDTGGLDGIHPYAGQYRYVVDLVRGLAELRPPCRFVLFGAREQPPPEVRELFSGGAWEYRSFPRSSGRASFYRDLVRFGLALRRERIDLCHCLHSFLPLFPPCPIVATQHDMMYELFPEYAEAVRSRPYRITRWLLRTRVNRIVCISQTTANDVHHLWGVSRDRLNVVPHGSSLAGRVPLSPAAPAAAELARLDAGRILVSPYNLEPRKNLSGLLETVTRLRPAHPDLKLVLFGRAAVTPSREERFCRDVRRLGIEDQIVRTGFLSDEDLAWLYRRATIFVFPSLYEGFGLPVLEAMAGGACVVVRDASAMAEVVGEAGVRVETKNVEALAGAISNLLSAPSRREALSSAARERAKTFTVRRMAQQTFESYLPAWTSRAQESAPDPNLAGSGLS
jgi:glycosyltransferase involved in cell wall biosynthesis